MNHVVSAHDLAHISLADTQVLSLDCFDTLLWRNTLTPTDVFYTLCDQPLFKKHRVTARARSGGERNARFLNKLNRNSTEVSIEDIYKSILPHAEDELIRQFVDAEVQIEFESTFLFKPVFDLLTRAKSKGLRTIIVSDTYLNKEQILRLINKPGSGMATLIDEIYCSSEYGMSKAAGLFKPVLKALGMSSQQITHLGDNVHADYHGAKAFHINAYHLSCFLPETTEKINNKTQPALIYLPNVRLDQGMPHLHHHQLATIDSTQDKSYQFGYTAIGGILNSFAKFLKNEIKALERAGEQPKVGFLLRDAYLISKIYSECYADVADYGELNISRFTAIAASLHNKEAVLKQIYTKLSVSSIPTLIKQFLLPAELAEKINNLCSKAANPSEKFIELILQKSTLQTIHDESFKFRKRLINHIQDRLDLKSGDTLVLVDLGYSGTAQLLLKDILKEDLNVNCIGRYLICDEVVESGHDRKGLIDFSQVDIRIIQSITGWVISFFEMLCTQNAPSTLGYSIDGNPVFAKNTLSDEQYKVVEKIQSGCIQFCKDAVGLAAMFKPRSTDTTLWQTALIDLASLLYYPTPTEIECARQLEFDYNLGTENHMSLLDIEACKHDLHTQGMAYLNDSSKDRRTCHSLELRHTDLALSSLMNTALRFNFSVDSKNSSYKKEILAAIVLKGLENTLTTVMAHHTHDEFFSVSIPIGKDFSTGVLLGKNYEYFELQSIFGVSLRHPGQRSLLTAQQDFFLQDATQLAGQLIQAAESGLIFIPPAQQSELSGVKIVFRPIVKRIAIVH